MFRLSVIEESLNDNGIVKELEKYFYSQRIENVPEDEYPIWHVNEYRMTEKQMLAILDILRDNVKPTWYIHAFDDENMYVVLMGKWFRISLKRDETWDEMIEYGVSVGKVERVYLENIPLQV